MSQSLAMTKKLLHDLQRIIPFKNRQDEKTCQENYIN